MVDQTPEDALLIELGLTEKQYVAALKRIEANALKSARRQETAFKRSNDRTVSGFTRVDRGASRMASGGLRQASMQLSQVAQQGAATGNYLQALAVQAPDLALGFGALGIAVGALIPVLYGVAQGAFGAEEALGELDIQGTYSSAESLLNRAREAQDRYTAAIRLSGQAQSEVTPEILESLRLEAAARQELFKLQQVQLQQDLRRLEAELADKNGELDALLARATATLSDDPNLRAQGAIERRRAEITEQVLADNEALVLSIREQQAELDLVTALIEQGHGEAAELVDEMIDAANEGARLKGELAGIDMGSINAQAAFLAAQIGLAADEAIRYNNALNAAAGIGGSSLGSQGLSFGTDGSTTDDPMLPGFSRLGFGNLENRPQRQAPVDLTPPKTRHGGARGGGASEAEKEQNRLLSERDRILRSLETAQEKHERQMADINALYAQGELDAAQYAAAMAQIDDELQDAEFGALITAIEDVSGAMADAIVNGENMGEALKAVFNRIARDLVASGIRSLLLETFGLADQKSGGGSLLGGFLNLLGGGRAGGGPARAGTPYLVNENTPNSEIFVPSQSGGVLNVAQAQQALRAASTTGGSGGEVDVRIAMDRSGNLVPVIERVSGRVAARAVGQADKALPSRMTQIQSDPRRRPA